MELDARKMAEGTRLETGVCIVGAGPAGITLARELTGRGVEVHLLESGGMDFEESLQDLNAGPVVGDAYAGLQQARRRQAGGAANLWNTPVGAELGAKFVPLDPWDFEARAEPTGGWPFDRSHLDPFYQRAQVVCGLGPFAYGGEDWSDADHPCFDLDGDRLATRVYQFGPGRLFTGEYLRELRVARNVHLCHHATACRLETESGGRRVARAIVASSTGNRFTVTAGYFVLAAGAVENARLLLLSRDALDAPGNRHGWLGRCFMEHPRDRALTLVPRSPEMFRTAAFYDAHVARGGHIVGGRLAMQGAPIRDGGLPNASVTLLPRLRNRPSSGGAGARMLRWLRRLGSARPATGYGWSRQRDPAAVYDAFHLLVNLEQRPHPENRIVLSPARDAFGSPRAELHWEWRGEEQVRLELLRAFLARAIEDAGLGTVLIDAALPSDPNAHHHAGTTRMSADPHDGVVDANSRVHGMENLYVSGASVFPTAGFANPVLTIVALALRLADHLWELR